MMSTLVQMVQEKTGISEEQAQMAVGVIASYLKDKLPAPLAGQIDGLLGSDAGSHLDQASSMLGGLGGMFGKSQG